MIRFIFFLCLALSQACRYSDKCDAFDGVCNHWASLFLFYRPVTPLNDFNGDGYADLLVSAHFNQGTGAADKGVAYIFYGSATGPALHATSATPYTCSGPPDCTVIQNPDNEASGFFGFSVAALGDVNRDGYSDLAVSAYQNQGLGAADKGVVYVFYGGPAGITSHPSGTGAYGCGGVVDCVTIQNPEEEASGNFGYAIGAAGDVNHDGYNDLIVGALRNQGAGAVDKGAAYIYYGSRTGFTSHPTGASTYSCTGPPDCTVIQNPLNEASGFFGVSVALAGDVNRDGYADVVVGASQNQAGGGAVDKGSAYVFYGGPGGIASHPLGAGTYNCSGPLDCTVIENPDDEGTGFFGVNVASAGDVNRDGYSDVLIAADQNQGAGNGNKGSAYVFYGGPSGVTAHSENATPYSCTGPPDCTVVQNPEDENLGLFGQRLSGAQDVNRDGYDDILISADYNQGGGAADKGAAYIFYGSSTGITTHVENATSYTCSGPPDCTVIQNPDNEGTGLFSASVSFAGDLNGDGFADIAVGAHGNQGAGIADKGVAYTFFGGLSGITVHSLSTVAYTCAGPPDCTAIQNPDNENTGDFGSLR